MPTPKYTNQSVYDNEAKRRKLGIQILQPEPSRRAALDVPFADQDSGGDPLAEARAFLQRMKGVDLAKVVARDKADAQPGLDRAALARQPQLPVDTIAGIRGLPPREMARLATTALAHGPSTLAGRVATHYAGDRPAAEGIGDVAREGTGVAEYSIPPLRMLGMIDALRQAAFPTEDESRSGGVATVALNALPSALGVAKRTLSGGAQAAAAKAAQKSVPYAVPTEKYWPAGSTYGEAGKSYAPTTGGLRPRLATAATDISHAAQTPTTTGVRTYDVMKRGGKFSGDRSTGHFTEGPGGLGDAGNLSKYEAPFETQIEAQARTQPFFTQEGAFGPPSGGNINMNAFYDAPYAQQLAGLERDLLGARMTPATAPNLQGLRQAAAPSSEVSTIHQQLADSPAFRNLPSDADIAAMPLQPRVVPKGPRASRARAVAPPKAKRAKKAAKG